jgi:serine protease inhibitor
VVELLQNEYDVVGVDNLENSSELVLKAVTQVQMRCKSLNFDGPQFEFIADRPFAVMITSPSLKMVLFAGYIAQPF